MKIEDVPIEKIHIGQRFRTDDGDLESLAANIRDIGLLQPIGIDEYYRLVFGSRRLLACGDILKWETIPCAVLKINSLLAGEFAENEFRKQFTPSERAAIGEAIEQELGDRRGKRSELTSNWTEVGETRQELGDRQGKLTELASNWTEAGETRALAAKRAGFESWQSYQRAKTVTVKGTPELVAAMDSGDVSIAAAASIASQPQTEQKRILQMPKDERREIVRQIRKTKADQEANERHARDLRIYRGLYDAVTHIANIHEDPKETWAGLWRVAAINFNIELLDQALGVLTRLRKEHPNEPKRPSLIKGVS